MKALRSMLHFFLLLAFFLPVAGGTLHAFGHAEDVHCMEFDEKHFHEAFHHCTLCDFTFTSCGIPPLHSWRTGQLDFVSSVSCYTEPILLTKPFSIKQLRAPPRLSDY